MSWLLRDQRRILDAHKLQTNRERRQARLYSVVRDRWWSRISQLYAECSLYSEERDQTDRLWDQQALDKPTLGNLNLINMEVNLGGNRYTVVEMKSEVLLSIDEFDRQLHEAEADFKEEVMKWMALLKVRDEDIFNQVMNEIEVDYE